MINFRFPFLKIFLLFLIFDSFYACSKLRKATDVITNPSAREIYEREYKDAPAIFDLWKMEAEKALFDSVSIDLPYTENGKFFPKTFPIYSYQIELRQGERLQVKIDIDSIESLIFIDLYQKFGDSTRSFQHIESAAFEKRHFQKEISETGTYKLLIQPEITAFTAFNLQIYTEPVYTFPVVSQGNNAVRSSWGADRDGGRRSHEGIDIFASRGTPVIAATEGRVSYTGNKGLGGKQVWLQDRERGISLYYAHLDSIIASAGMKVAPGDTLGLVGNTGNARTTPPHLHFGIYEGYQGAVDPMPYVYISKKPELDTTSFQSFSNNLLITTGTANLRSSPATNSIVLDQAEPNDSLRLLGKTQNWFHIRKNGKSAFIHESLVSTRK